MTGSKMTLQVGRLLSMSSETARMFATVEPRPWSIEALCIELIAEYGSLAHCVMDKGGYKLSSHFDPSKAEDECSDVVFILMRLLDVSGCESSPEMRLRFDPPTLEEAPESLFLAAAEAIPRILTLAGSKEVEEPVLQAMTMVARLASGLGLRPLEVVHEETMRRTQNWIRAQRRLGTVRGAIRRARSLFRRS